MCRAGVTVDMISCNAAISACKKGGQWQQALSLLDDMHKASVTVDVISFNTAIPAFKKGGKWQQALSVDDGKIPKLGAKIHQVGSQNPPSWDQKSIKNESWEGSGGQLDMQIDF